MEVLRIFWTWNNQSQSIRERPRSISMSHTLLLFLLLTSLTGAAPLHPCPEACICVSKTGWVWCIGGRYEELPALPGWTRQLSWTGLEVSRFSLSHIPRTAVSVVFRGLNFNKLLPGNSGIPARAQKLQIEGCCATQFPNLADFQNLASLQYNVGCPRGIPGIDISNPMLAGVGQNLAKRDLKRFEASACISIIDVSSIREIFRYEVVYLKNNRLRDFSSGSMISPNVKELYVSGNPRMTQMDIGPDRVALKKLDLSQTRLPMQGIAADSNRLLDLRQRQSSVPLDLQWLCERFPKLVRLNVGERTTVLPAGVGKCAELGELFIDAANQRVVPDLRKTKIYHFVAARNHYTKLDFESFNLQAGGFHTRKIDVSFNAIRKVVVNSSAACDVLEKMDVLDLSYNNLTTISYDFIKCLPHSLAELSLNVSGNPMQNLFSPFFQAPQTPGRTLRILNISNVPSIRNRGIFPAWLFSNFGEITEIVAERNNLLSVSRFLALLRAANLQAGLRDLRLADNRFSDIANRLFLGFGRLQQLNLARNHLQSLGQEAFSGLTALTALDLSGNKLEVLEAWPLRLPSNSRVLLDSNPFRCSCKALQRLNNTAIFKAARLQEPRCAEPEVALNMPLQEAMQRNKYLWCPGKQPFFRDLSSAWVIFALVVGVVVVSAVSVLITRCLLKKSDKYWMTTKYTRQTLPQPVAEDLERVGMMPR